MALVAAVSVSLVAVAALLLAWDVLRCAPVDGREVRTALDGFYWTRISPLVHRPCRRLLLRAGVALVIVIAPAIRLAW